MAREVNQVIERSVRRQQLADRAAKLAISVIVREIVDGFVTVQFFNEMGNDKSAAGILSMPIEEWRAPAWQTLRDQIPFIRQEW